MGRWRRSEHREKVEGYIAKGKTEARLVAGGGGPKGLERGWFLEPTVFAHVSNSATIAQEEIFGPVLAVIPYGDDADAVRLANDSAYGLGGAVFSADPKRAIDIARRVQTGTIGINGYPVAIGSPFGGVKASGLGREFGPEALSTYQQLKSLYVSAYYSRRLRYARLSHIRRAGCREFTAFPMSTFSDSGTGRRRRSID